MTVSDLTPVELFSIQVFGIGYCGLCIAAIYAARRASGRKEVVMFAAGLFCLVGLPALKALSLIAP